MKNMTALLTLMLINGCASQRVNEYEDKIVTTSDGKMEFPEWAYSRPHYIESETLFVSGSTEISADQNVETGLDAATLIARSNIAAEIKDRMKRQVQYANENLDLDTQQLQRIIESETELSRMSGVSLSKRWFAKISTQKGGSRVVRYRCFALVELPISAFKENIARDLSGTKGISSEFKEKLDKSWDKFFTQNDKASN